MIRYFNLPRTIRATFLLVRKENLRPPELQRRKTQNIQPGRRYAPVQEGGEFGMVAREARSEILRRAP